MNTVPKDDPLVIEFLAAFSRLRDACDDDASDVIRQAAADDSFAKICARACEAYEEIIEIEDDTSEKTIRFVGSEFIKARRLFEDKFRLSAISAAMSLENPEAVRHLAELERVTGRSLDEYARRLKKGFAKDTVDWEGEDQKANKVRDQVSDALCYAWDTVHNGGEAPDEFDLDNVEEGLERLTWLTNGFGPDVQGLFRRRALTPLTLVPTRISHGDGDQLKVTALTLLDEAQRAFIFGAPFAALTLLRAIVELVLTDHFRISGRDLAEQISKAGKLLPSGVYPNDLHRLRMDANSLLHGRGERQKEAGVKSRMDLELSIAQHLDKIRLLLEGFAK